MIENLVSAKTEPGIKPNPDYQPALKKDISLDELLGHLGKPRENLQPDPPPSPAGTDGPAQSPNQPPFTPGGFDQEPAAPISREDAERAGRRIATMVDSVFSVAGMMIAKEQSAEKYKASEGEKTDLAEAWSQVSEEYQFKVNPWLNIVILTLMVYTPKIIQATNDRRIKVLEEKQRETEARLKTLEDKQRPTAEATTK